MLIRVSERSANMPTVTRVLILLSLLQGIACGQEQCTLSNGVANGFFGGVDVSGFFTSGANPDTSSITVSGAYTYTFTGPLNGAGYTETSQIPAPPCILGPPCPVVGTAGLHVVPYANDTAASLGFEDSGEIFTGSANLSCTAIVGPPPPPIVPSSEIAIRASGLAYSRVSQTFNGTITITNTSNTTITTPTVFDLELTALTAGVTVVDSSGTYNGNPYITVPNATSVAPGKSLTVAVQFKNPSGATISFTPEFYAGSLQ